jgi:hypothetical protein
MRQWITLVVIGSFLLNLTACARDSMKYSSELPPGATMSPAEQPMQPSTEPPSAEPSGEVTSGEVQERAVKPLLPTLKLPPDTKLPTLLPGHFGIMTFYGYWVTAVGGGGRTSDAFHTDARQIQAWEKFRLMPLGRGYAIVTPTGNYVTAVGGGNRIAEPVLQSDRTQAQEWELFLPYMNSNSGWFNLRTASGRYLTAVNAGNNNTNPFHTDAVKADRWEAFGLYKCGALGSGYQYAIVNPTTGGPLRALDGGGRTTADAIGLLLVKYDDWARFRLIRQNDGSYALQTSNGINYVTAVNGGGVVLGPKTPVALQTDRTQVQDWEKFRIVDIGNCTYTIQTLSGWYFDSSRGNISTGRSDINYATKYRLIMFGLDRLSPP